MKKIALPFILIILISASVYSVNTLYNIHGANKERILGTFSNLPEPIASAACIEFKGLVSDFLMLKVLSFSGDRIMSREKLTPAEWQAVYRTLSQSSNLDPRFYDPYLVAAMSLPFETNMVDEANTLLEKAGKILTDDYRPYFFMWYNYVFIKKDKHTAAEYLKKAALKPNAPDYLAILATRTALGAGDDIFASVAYLQAVIEQTKDPNQIKMLKIRQDALGKIGYLQDKIKDYKKIFHIPPKNLSELVTKGIIPEIPKDPYGGTFYIQENGSVYTTSRLVFINKSIPAPSDNQ